MDHERNGKTGISMKRASLYMYLHSSIKMRYIQLQFYIIIACVK